MLFEDQNLPLFLKEEYEYFLRVFVRSMRVLQAINYHDIDNFSTNFQKNLYHFFCKNIWADVRGTPVIDHLHVRKLVKYFREDPFLNQVENSEFRERMIRLIENDPYFIQLSKETKTDRRRIERSMRKLESAQT